MTVSELMELLEDCDPDAEVVLSSDPEGNDYAPLHSFADSMVYTDDREVTEEEDAEGLGCVVLWPG